MNASEIIKSIEAEQLKAEVPDSKSGDTGGEYEEQGAGEQQ